MKLAAVEEAPVNVTRKLKKLFVASARLRHANVCHHGPAVVGCDKSLHLCFPSRHIGTDLVSLAGSNRDIRQPTIAARVPGHKDFVETERRVQDRELGGSHFVEESRLCQGRRTILVCREDASLENPPDTTGLRALDLMHIVG